ncbi:MAG: hypothetical protein LBJ11_04175 [Oscillospiraceae bacterium]|jgi:hypothetical protein|nr:hypothetical protein [Oscillospiraceae bacterium]
MLKPILYVFGPILGLLLAWIGGPIVIRRVGELRRERTTQESPDPPPEESSSRADHGHSITGMVSAEGKMAFLIAGAVVWFLVNNAEPSDDRKKLASYKTFLQKEDSAGPRKGPVQPSNMEEYEESLCK